MEIENLTLKEFIKENLRKGIYLIIIVISRISSIVYTKEKRKIENVYQLQAAKQYYKKGSIPITINLRNLKQNRQRKDLFKDKSKIGILSDQD